jgi:hypothetical protein
MADRSSARVPLAAARVRLVAAALGAALAVGVGTARAAEIKTSGHLDIPPTSAVMAVCTDPVVQNVLSEDFRLAKRTGPMQLVTVTVNARALGPGVTVQNLAPGDPEIATLLKALGAQPLPLGDTGNQPTDPYAIDARRQATMPEDPLMQQFRGYQAAQRAMGGANAPSPYESLPQDQIYDTAIIARATIAGSPHALRVVALVHPGDDVRMAKKLVAEEIANAILH